MKNILIIDNNSISKKKLSEYLIELGYFVSSIKQDVSATLQKVTANEINLIIFNSSELNEDTINFCKQLNQNKVKENFGLLLLCDPKTNPKLRTSDLIGLYVDDILYKPFKMVELKNKVVEYIDKYQKRNQLNKKIRRLPLKGTFSKIEFPELLHTIHRNKYEGILYVQRGDESKEIYFQQGNPIYISSNIESEWLGNILIKLGKITPHLEQLSRRKMSITNKSQGEILIEMGEVTPYDIYEATLLQFNLKLLNIFKWVDGIYQYNSTKVDKPIEIPLSEFNLIKTIKMGVEKYYNLQRLEKFFAYRTNKLLSLTKYVNQILPEIALTHQEKLLLMSIKDNNLSIPEAISISKMDLEKTLKTIFIFIILGIVQIGEESYIDSVFDFTNESFNESTSNISKYESTDELFLKSSFNKIPYPNLLALLYLYKKSGTLTIRKEQDFVSIYFKCGKIVNVESTYIRGHNLRDILAEFNKIPPGISEFTEVNMHNFNSVQQGEMLIAIGCLTYEELAEALQIETYRKLFIPFKWEDAEFEFKESDICYQDQEGSDINIKELIAEGVRNYFTLDKLQDIIYPFKKYNFDKLELTPKIIHTIIKDTSHIGIMHALINYNTIQEVIEHSNIPLIYSLQIIYLFLLFNAIRLKGEKEFCKIPIHKKYKESITDKERFSTLESGKFVKSGPIVKTPPSVLYEEELVKSKPIIETPPSISIADSPFPDAEEDLKIVKSEFAFEQGQEYLKENDYLNAKRYFEEAINLNPDEPEFLAFLGWTLYHIPGQNKEDAKKLIYKTLEITPKNYNAHFFLGKIYAEEKNKGKALEELEEVLKINPSFKEAKDEIAKLANNEELDNQELPIFGDLSEVFNNLIKDEPVHNEQENNEVYIDIFGDIN